MASACVEEGGTSVKLCFGTFAKTLLLCGVDGIEKKRLLNVLVQSVDPLCTLSSSAVTALLQCASNLPDSRSNGLGDVISGAETADPRKVAQYFSSKVIPQYLDHSKRNYAVLAIREIIATDETIGGDTVVELVSGTTKNALLMQNTFVLSDLLAGVFLFVARIDNRAGKLAAAEISEAFVVSFEELQETISFVVPQKEGEIITSASPAFFDYMKNAKGKYASVKTLLYNNEPKPFYDFYVPNHASYTAGRRKDTLENVTAESLTAISNFIILAGTGGLGKSMMMRHLLLNAIENFSKLRRVPVFLPLKDYGESAGGLEDFVYSKAEALNPAITKEDYTDALAQGLFLLLFDGLDEIDGEHSARFEREIEAFTDKYPHNCFVISSRPFQSFISYTRFSKVGLHPFTKDQALELIDKSDFRPDQPEIRQKFRGALDKTLFRTHMSFAQNPLLLTIMLLTFERFAEIPSKMHIFYREAFLALSVTHDANKGAYKRALKTGLNIDEVETCFAEICFRSYRDQKYEFTDTEFTAYFGKLSKSGKIKSASDFLYDMCHNLCLMYYEGGKYHFVHRSFQEYFAAVFMSKQNDEFIGKLGSFFEKRAQNLSVSAFPMLYDIIPERVEQFIFVPYLSKLFAECDAAEGYWTFLEEMYPNIYYINGEVDDSFDNDSESYMFDFILNQLDYKYTESPDDLPFFESLVTEEVSEDIGPLICSTSDGAGGCTWKTFEWPYYEMEEGEEPPEPEIVGYKLEFNIWSDRQKPQYRKLIAMLEHDSFKIKSGYNAARAFLDTLVSKIRDRRDDLNDLL